jgi:hypothetical protein
MLPFGAQRHALTLRQGGAWFNASAYADLAAIADFNNDRYALPAFGPELAVNGDFASDLSNWTATNSGTGTSTWVAGAMQLVGNGAGNLGYRQQLVATEVGKLYAVTFTQTGVQGFHYFGPTATAYVAGTQTVYFTATSASSVIGFGNSSTVGTLTIDNVSVREVILTRGAGALGANKFTDPGFTTVTGWSAAYQSTVTAVGGRMRVTAAGGTNPYASYQFTDLEIGAKYRFMWTGFAGTAAIPELILGNTAPLARQEYGAGSGAISGFQQLEFTATSVNLYIKFRLGSTTIGNYFEVDDVSLQKLPATGAYPKRGATFAEWLAFTAASTTARSYVASDGLWKNDLAANAPRFDFRNGKRQLRLEGERTKLVVRSNDQSNAAWVITGGASVGAPVLSPSGGADAYPITFAASSAAGLTQNLTGLTASTTYTASLWVRCLSGTELVRIKVWDNTSDKFSSDITVTTAWQRVTFTLTTGATTPTSPNIEIRNASDGLARTVLVYEAELEVGAFASDPIPTLATAVTRAIETARFSPLLEAIMQRAAASVVVRGRLDANSLTNFPRIVGGASGHALLSSGSSGASVLSYNGTTGVSGSLPTGALSSPFGVGSNFDSAGRSAVGNGGTVGSDTAAAGDRSQLYLSRGSSIGTGTEYGHGLYDFVGISPERLSSTTLQALAVPA